MSMDTVKAIMKEAGWGDLATTDGEKAYLRPMGGWAWVEGELWCASGAGSEKVSQLKQRPDAEYCFTDRQGRHVRIAGPCTVSTHQTDKDTLYELVPALKQHIADPKSPEYVVLRMKPASIRLMASHDLRYTDVEPE